MQQSCPVSGTSSWCQFRKRGRLHALQTVEVREAGFGPPFVSVIDFWRGRTFLNIIGAKHTVRRWPKLVWFLCLSIGLL